VELALLEVRGLIEATVLKHRHRLAQNSMITAVGAEREEDVKVSCLRLVDDATETVDAVLADAEYAEAVRAVYAKLATEKPELRIRLLCTQGVLDLGLVHPDVLERPCVEVRVARVSMLQAMIVDSRAALVTAPSAAGRQASVIRSATVIRTLGPLFESLWQHAVAVTDRIDLEERNWAKAPARILECLQAGVTDEAAARELSVSVRTYRRYVAEIMTLLGAFMVLLARYSRQEDIVVGTAIANRNRREVEGLIGFFVNTLALRSDLSGDPSVLEVIKQEREVALGAYGHQEVPFEQLVQELGPERSLSHSPLFQVMMVMRNGVGAAVEVEGLRFEPVELEQKTSKFDLTVSLIEEGGRISGGASRTRTMRRRRW
jgi:hypothetical protein